MGHIAFCHDVRSICAYVCMSFRFTLTFTSGVSLGGHSLGTFYARKLNFGMLLTQIKTFNYVLELPLGWG